MGTENRIKIEQAVVMLDSSFVKYSKTRISELIESLKTKNKNYSFYPIANKEHVKTFFEKVLMYPNIEICFLVGGEYSPDFTNSDIETLVERAKNYIGCKFDGDIEDYARKINEKIDQYDLEKRLQQILEENENLSQEFEKIGK